MKKQAIHYLKHKMIPDFYDESFAHTYPHYPNEVISEIYVVYEKVLDDPNLRDLIYEELQVHFSGLMSHSDKKIKELLEIILNNPPEVKRAA